jgi:hypothetical protein
LAANADINTFLQQELEGRRLYEVDALTAARWLHEEGLLKDSGARPGLPLRKKLRAGLIRGAEQRPSAKGGRWFIRRLRVESASGRELRNRHAGSQVPVDGESLYLGAAATRIHEDLIDQLGARAALEVLRRAKTLMPRVRKLFPDWPGVRIGRFDLVAPALLIAVGVPEDEVSRLSKGYQRQQSVDLRQFWRKISHTDELKRGTDRRIRPRPPTFRGAAARGKLEDVVPRGRVLPPDLPTLSSEEQREAKLRQQERTHRHQRLLKRFLSHVLTDGVQFWQDPVSFDLVLVPSDSKRSVLLGEVKTIGADEYRQIRTAIGQLFLYEQLYVRPRWPARKVLRCIVVERPIAPQLVRVVSRLRISCVFPKRNELSWLNDVAADDDRGWLR